jgi:hypothetical protein
MSAPGPGDTEKKVTIAPKESAQGSGDPGSSNRTASRRISSSACRLCRQKKTKVCCLMLFSTPSIELMSNFRKVFWLISLFQSSLFLLFLYFPSPFHTVSPLSFFDPSQSMRSKPLTNFMVDSAQPRQLLVQSV